MRARSLVALAAVIFVGLARSAHADPRGDIEKKIKEAMESYDLMDYDASKKLLNQALASAKKAKLDKDPIAAKAYLDLGIVSFVNNDQDAAKLSFLSAVQIDPKIQIDPAYKSPEMAKLLEEARSEAKGSGGGSSEPVVSNGGGGGDCAGVSGLDHTIIDNAKAGVALPIEAQLGSDVKAAKVSVMFRPEGSTDFTEVKMTKQGDCKYVAQIPASALKGSLVHYYVAAFNAAGKVIASKGAAGSPNIVELTGGGGGAKSGGGGDDEDPLGNGKKPPPPSGGGDSGGGEVSGGDTTSSVTVGAPKASKVSIMASVGSGFGFLAANNVTEAMNPVKSAGFGTAWAVFTPEIAYAPSAQLSIGLAGRFAIPVGANIDGHSPVGPAGLLRLRYAFDPSGNGVHIMGQAGVGILRSTLQLDNTMSGMGDVDIVAQGPLLLGAGLGYAKHVSSSVTFLADLGALAGIAVVDKIGLAPMNTGVTLDISLGLAFGL
jgi:hypothetical protein